MDLILQQERFGFDFNRELLMNRIAEACQCKLNPNVSSRTEIPLRKVLLSTRLLSNIRREQALVSMNTEDWLFNQPQTQTEQIVNNIEMYHNNDIISTSSTEELNQMLTQEEINNLITTEELINLITTETTTELISNETTEELINLITIQTSNETNNSIVTDNLLSTNNSITITTEQNIDNIPTHCLINENHEEDEWIWLDIKENKSTIDSLGHEVNQKKRSNEELLESTVYKKQKSNFTSSSTTDSPASPVNLVANNNNSILLLSA